MKMRHLIDAIFSLLHTHPPSLPPSPLSVQLLQELGEMRGDLQQAKKQKSRAEASLAGMEEELVGARSAQRRSGSKPATEDAKKELQK